MTRFCNHQDLLRFLVLDLSLGYDLNARRVEIITWEEPSGYLFVDVIGPGMVGMGKKGLDKELSRGVYDIPDTKEQVKADALSLCGIVLESFDPENQE